MGQSSSADVSEFGTPSRDYVASTAPLPTSLAECGTVSRGKCVVLAGCGGGFDAFGACVLFHGMADAAERIVLNFSFTRREILEKRARKVTSSMWRVDPGLDVAGQHFAEALLATQLKQPVYALVVNGTSVADVGAAYRALLAAASQPPDALYLVDGGCDVLLTGRETGLATPVEDMMHLRVAAALPIPRKVIVALGTNVDCGHGVVQEELDARLEAYRSDGTMLFEHPLGLETDECARFYHAAVMASDPVRTIVQSLVCASLEGHRGLYTPEHLEHRIGENTVPITDQTSTAYAFDLVAVAQQVEYLGAIAPGMKADNVSDLLAAYMARRDAKRAIAAAAART